jgi:arginine N-succinyltransferase
LRAYTASSSRLGDVARCTFAQAEQHFGPGWAREVAALMPRHPLLVSFLPEAAQAALSVVHENHRAAAWALSEAGLSPGVHVGLLDGGPVFEASLRRGAGAGYLP